MGLNVEAIHTNQAVLVNDVRQDARYLPDLNLPEARSELVVPLQLGDRMIGTLDVVSSLTDAFSDEDKLVIQSLGDQVAVAIENARLYAQGQELAVLEERTRLSRDLHDSVIQSLYSLTLLAEGWRKMSQTGEPMDIEHHLDRVVGISHQALKEMRLLIHELRPPALEREGLMGALHQRLGAVESRAGIQSRLTAEELIDLPATVEEQLYRIAQEALNNVLRHSSANKVWVSLSCIGENVVMEISDDGDGFVYNPVVGGGGSGLGNMQERAQAMGGSVMINSELGEGTCVRVTAPINESPDLLVGTAPAFKESGPE
jgi:signal transduction histidine kinase